MCTPGEWMATSCVAKAGRAANPQARITAPIRRRVILMTISFRRSTAFRPLHLASWQAELQAVAEANPLRAPVAEQAVAKSNGSAVKFPA